MPSPRYRPTLETLERRCVPAVVVTTGIDLDSDGNADDIRIVGDAKNNVIDIDDDGATLLIDVDKNGDGDFTDPGELLDFFQTPGDGTIVLDVRLGDGNDSIFYNLSADLSAERRSLSADLGAGNDDFDFTATATSDVTNSSALVLDILGGAGADQLDITLRNVSNSLVAIQAAMAGSSDSANVLLTGVVDGGASVDVDIDLGGGGNFSIVTIGDVGNSLAGFVDVNVTGSNSATKVDVVTLNLVGDVGDGINVSSVSVAVELLAGNDDFNGVLNLTTFNVDPLGTVELSVQGGAGNDTLDLTTANAGAINIGKNAAEVAVLDLELKGGLGNDIIGVDLSAANCLAVVGEFRLRVEGNEGSDTINANLRNTGASTGNYNILIQGNAGNDTVTYDLEAAAAAVTFGPAGKVLLDGGLGSDTLDDNSLPTQSDHQFFEIFV